MQTEQLKTNGTNGHALMRPELAALSIHDVDAHPNNPRKTFTEIDELADSIKVHGLLEPIMVRPKGKRYEIVFGERRWRASKRAKQPTILSLVRDLDDAQCEQIMVVENTKRSDLHPLEEAEGYERLHKVHGMTVEEIAAKVNKSVAQIYARMKLCALCKKAREAFYAGELDASKALLLARIPREELQLEALKEITKPRDTWIQDNGIDVDDRCVKVAPSYREAAAIVQARYMLRLVDAPFDRANATLVAKAGACTSCPKRTGNQKELFADVKSSDVCTDPTCFRSKVDAHWDELKKSAKDKGVDVLSDKEGAKLFEYGRVAHDSGFVDLDEERFDHEHGKNTTARKTLGKKVPAITLARDANGRIHELVKAADLPKAKKDKDTPSKAEQEARAKERAEAKKEKAKEAVVDKCNELAIASMVEKAEGKLPTADFYRALAVAIVTPYEVKWHDEDVHEAITRVLVARKLIKEPAEAKRTTDGQWNSGDVEKAIAKLPEKTTRSLLVELTASIAIAHEPHERSAFDMLCDFYKVDPKKFHAEAKASVGAGAKS